MALTTSRATSSAPLSATSGGYFAGVELLQVTEWFTSAEPQIDDMPPPSSFALPRCRACASSRRTRASSRRPGPPGVGRRLHPRTSRRIRSAARRSSSTRAPSQRDAPRAASHPSS
jgi:hypothetical protein